MVKAWPAEIQNSSLFEIEGVRAKLCPEKLLAHPR
jgi:hypothetical protein